MRHYLTMSVKDFFNGLLREEGDFRADALRGMGSE